MSYLSIVLEKLAKFFRGLFFVSPGRYTVNLKFDLFWTSRLGRIDGSNPYYAPPLQAGSYNKV